MKIAIVTVVWLLLVLAGTFALEKYASSPGAEATPPRTWPSESALKRQPDQPTLVMLNHPRCPCSRASLAELDDLLSQYRGKLTAYIVFIQPKGVEYSWTQTELWRLASRIDGARVVVDHDSIESDRFQAQTSGHVLLYSAAGDLQFSGGITAARGHLGDSLGFDRLLTMLRGDPADRADAPVFGCPLHAGNDVLPGINQ